MKAFNYNTIKCSNLGDVTPNNLKEFADKMVNYFGVASYNENGINLTASVVNFGGASYLAITLNGENRGRHTFSGKRVSESMGRSIYNVLNDIINDALEIGSEEFAAVTTDFDASTLFETSVADVLETKQGEGHPLPKPLIDFFERNGVVMTYGVSTYPFKMTEEIGSYKFMTTDPLKGDYIPKTYEDLVRPMCEYLGYLDESGEYYERVHSLDDVWIEGIDLGIAKDGSYFGCEMVLGS